MILCDLAELLGDRLLSQIFPTGLGKVVSPATENGHMQMPWDRTKVPDDWFRAFTHESGHAVMAALQSVPCYGVFLRKSPLKACVLVPPLPPPSQLSNEIRMYLVAGSAAEQLVLRKQDFGGSREDRRLFGAPDGFTFDDKVKQAEAILLNHKPRIEKLAYRLDGMYRKAGGDFSGFRSQLVRMGQEIHDHWVLLDEEELKAELS